MSDLAIVIPAYKNTFLDEAIHSVASQTCKDFTLYVGDDCSPYNLYEIVKPYMDKIDVVYHRFETNCGEKDLVAQWERCIALSKNEKWIWLFSDDDVMEPNCVERFYEAIKTTVYDVYHFNIKVIDGKSNLKSIPPEYPSVIGSYDFYKKKMRGKIMSLVVENIFSRDIYIKRGGFQNFDLAWGSDTATWVKFAFDKGLYTIPVSHVCWRSSGQNISPDNSGKTVERKVNALLDYFDWSYKYFKSKGIDCSWFNIFAFTSRLRYFRQFLPNNNIDEIIKQFLKNYHFRWLYFLIKLIVKL